LLPVLPVHSHHSASGLICGRQRSTAPRDPRRRAGGTSGRCPIGARPSRAGFFAAFVRRIIEQREVIARRRVERRWRRAVPPLAVEEVAGTFRHNARHAEKTNVAPTASPSAATMMPATSSIARHRVCLTITVGASVSPARRFRRFDYRGRRIRLHFPIATWLRYNVCRMPTATGESKPAGCRCGSPDNAQVPRIIVPRRPTSADRADFAPAPGLLVFRGQQIECGEILRRVRRGGCSPPPWPAPAGFARIASPVSRSDLLCPASGSAGVAAPPARTPLYRRLGRNGASANSNACARSPPGHSVAGRFRQATIDHLRQRHGDLGPQRPQRRGLAVQVRVHHVDQFVADNGGWPVSART